MAYPFLPVNPCCTDVVINDPCGCSSTITNSGCNNNPCSTHLTASSTIVYDGPVLPCIVAEPCDTLNVILQKIDEIICNLLTQINYLNNQVINIKNQIININIDILNIYNILDECCGATTTTTSTTIAVPCESFSLDNTGPDAVAIIITDCITGEQEAIVLLPGETNICVETDSPLTVPGTVIVTPNGPCGQPTTTTTTTIPPTTTTTTTAIPCECLTFENTDSSAVDHNISYNNCNGEIVETTISANETLQYCGSEGFADSALVFITIGANCIGGLSPVEPTTTTTSTTITCNCFDTEVTILSETLAATDNNELIVVYDDCFTNSYIDTFNRPGVYPLGCVDFVEGITALGQVDGILQAFFIPITTGSPCCDVEPTTTTTTSSSSSTTTSTTTIPPSTTTTTSSSSTTTTTTTTGITCDCLTFENTDTISHNLGYTDCSNFPVTGINIDPSEIISFCGDNPVVSDPSVNITIGGACILGVCPTTTTTTTILDCSFTGTATELPDTTTTTTSTSTSTSSTTTTTTTICVNCITGNVTIGTQVWTGCNLNITTFANGDPIPEVSDPTAWAALTTPAWCYYNNDPTNNLSYGKLYNWYAVNDPRGLAPTGYHVPSDAEWTTLTTFLGGLSVAGGPLKQTGTCFWNSPNTDATNSSGFSALAGGVRDSFGAFSNFGFNGNYWSSSLLPSTDYYYRQLHSFDGIVNRNYGNVEKLGFSVRVIQD
jgi:uncharacterized protein (TIGR02145 family)